MPTGMRTIAAIMAAAFVAIVPAHAQEDWRPQTSHEAARALVGNTLVYGKPHVPGEETGVFLRLDGTGSRATRQTGDQSEPSPIRWATLSDGNFCISGIGRRPWDGDCGTLSIDGSDAMLAPTSGPAWPGRVLEGDAWGLDPASAGATRLTGQAAIQSLVGNTLAFIAYGGGDRAYRAHLFLTGGTVRRAHNDDDNFDHWLIQRDERWSIREQSGELCLSGGAWKEDYCATVTVAGDLVTLRNERTGPLHARLLSGDAHYISTEAVAATRKTADALIGNSLLLKAADRQATTDSVMYFQSGGAGQGKLGDGAPQSIKWLLQPNGKLCVTLKQRAFRDADCSTLFIDNDSVTLASPDRPAISGRILRGNVLSTP